jgi:hypothetical protein
VVAKKKGGLKPPSGVMRYLAVSEVHGDFKTNTHIFVSGLSPHNVTSLLIEQLK